MTKEWRKNAGAFPITTVANRLVEAASRGAGRDCAAGGALPGAGCRAFRGTSECLFLAAKEYLRTPILSELPLRKPQGPPDAVAIAMDLTTAIRAWEGLSGRSIVLADKQYKWTPRELLERIGNTGQGTFAEEAEGGVQKLLFPNVTLNRGRAREGVSSGRMPCQGQVVTQAELMFLAIDGTDGRVTEAMGALAGLLHDGLGDGSDARVWAECVNGLWREEYKDYYRFAGLYIGLQPLAENQKGGLFAASGQTQVYGAARMGYECAKLLLPGRSVLEQFGLESRCNFDPLVYTYKYKLPELHAGFWAGALVREERLK
jgi:hypothetical protein